MSKSLHLLNKQNKYKKIMRKYIIKINIKNKALLQSKHAKEIKKNNIIDI